MNKPAMSIIRKQAQSGFTLIELIVVIVILGILAATALPRFSSLGGDARVASLNAARGSLSSVTAMVHGQFLMNPAGADPVYESIPVNRTNGYAAANINTATAAGLNANDYTITVGPNGGANANAPDVPAGSFLVQPVSVANNPAGLACHLMYTQSAGLNIPPVITLTSTNNCNN